MKSSNAVPALLLSPGPGRAAGRGLRRESRFLPGLAEDDTDADGPAPTCGAGRGQPGAGSR